MLKILLVEDDQVLQKMYHDKLQKEGYDVVMALDGRVGFDLALREQPDFILLDLMMPQTDGLTCLKLLKSRAETKDIPVAILSVMSEDFYDLDSDFLKANTVAYWRKDKNNPTQIVEEIEKLMQQKED